jgi:DNA helicase II / ATP-dependent DNA helicase PcrA
MNLVRHDLGFSKTDKRFPMKGTCLSIYSRAVNAEAPLDEVLSTSFPWYAEWETELRRLFGAYVEAKQKQSVLDYDDLLLYWAQMMVEGVVRAPSGEIILLRWRSALQPHLNLVRTVQEAWEIAPGTHPQRSP